MIEPASLDVETYSEAGYRWDALAGKWARLVGSREYGLPAVGSAAYAEHPSTEILCLAYALPGQPVQTWRQGDAPPEALLAWVRAGLPVRAHNRAFEDGIWHHVAVARMGWPWIASDQWRCSMATAHVNNYPGSLARLGEALGLDVRKDDDGKRLIKMFCVPHNPTKAEPGRLRIRPEDAPSDFDKLVAYCARDVETERAASLSMRSMTSAEHRAWSIDQQINARGTAVDLPSVRDLIAVMSQAVARYETECLALTEGIKPSQVAELLRWLHGRGVHLDTLDEDAATEALTRPDLPADITRVLEIRLLASAASVKKLYALERMCSADGRMRNLYVHHGARTGRPTGQGPQATNLPKDGPALHWDALGAPYGQHTLLSPWCGSLPAAPKPGGMTSGPWTWEACDAVLAIAARRDVREMERFFGSPLKAIMGTVRGLFVAGPGMELISSDYTAIEAVVAAAIAGEQWRLDAFERGDDIYLTSISRNTGISLEEYAAYKRTHGHHHPDRQRGKVGELAGGFGGWIGSWRAFGAQGTDAELKQEVLAWRKASPAIVEMWGGQGRGFPGSRDYYPERYGLEGAALNAIERPGTRFAYRAISFQVDDGTLAMRLPSGRELLYHGIGTYPSPRREGELAISFMTENSNPKYGPVGWVRMETYAGRLFENAVQAIAHDIQRHGIELLEANGYPVVMHTYDEMVSEVPNGFGTIEEYERLMTLLPPWAFGWPIKAAGGWRGHRYRKG
jgi:DNA polymerase